jgi:hypothetical protein
MPTGHPALFEVNLENKARSSYKDCERMQSTLRKIANLFERNQKLPKVYIRR